MRRVALIALASAAVLLAPASRALAAPVQIDFNVAGFGPTDEAHQSFTKNLLGLPSITFEALDASLNAAGHLHWDANDGNGYGDGFGVRDFADRYTGNSWPNQGQSYSQDEIEANERLRLTFSTAIILMGFNLTDFFFENEGNLNGLPTCVPNDPNCFRERGEYSIDNGLTWTPFFADPLQVRPNNTNGVLYVDVGGVKVTSLLFRAPGAIDVPDFAYRQLHEYSVAGIRLDKPDEDIPTPEPSSLVLLGLGLAGIGRHFRRRK